MTLKMALINETEFDYNFIKESMPESDVSLDFFHEVQDHLSYDLYFVDKKEDAPNIVKYIKSTSPKASIYVISDYDCPDTLKQFIKIGIDGFLDKHEMTEEDIKAIIQKESLRKSKINNVRNKLKCAFP